MTADQLFRLIAFMFLATGIVLAVWWDHNRAVPYRDVEED